MESLHTHKLDSSLKSKIPTPSRDFQGFLNDYFLMPMIFIRSEEDPTVFDRLQGTERDVAIEMIRANMDTGHAHILRAGVYLDLPETVDVARHELNIATDVGQRYEMAMVLDSMNAIDKNELFQIMEKGIEAGGDFFSEDIVGTSYKVLPVASASRIIEIGLDRNDAATRARAFFALKALEYIVKHGGIFTKDIGKKIVELEIQSYTSDNQDFHLQKEHYVGEEVYLNKSLFAQRLDELKKRIANFRS